MSSWRRSSSACPQPPTSRAPPRPASPSAASSPPTPSSADSAPSTRRPSSASSAAASSPPSRPLFSPRLKEGSDLRRSMYNPRDLVTEFAVCDPLHRRYLLLPALPDHLADLVHPPDIVQCEPFLAPPGDEDSSFTDFRVMCLVRCTTKLVPFVFYSCAGQWLAHPITFDEFGGYAASHRYYANGCFCWEVYQADKLLVLNAHSMEFSALDLPRPPGSYLRDMAIVEAGEGRLGMLTISDQFNHDACHLLYAVQCKDGNGANQWQSKSVIALPENYRYGIMGVAGGYLLLAGYPEDNRPIVDYFSLNLQTFQVEWFCQTGNYVMIGELYADLPLSLSSPAL